AALVRAAIAEARIERAVLRGRVRVHVVASGGARRVRAASDALDPLAACRVVEARSPLVPAAVLPALLALLRAPAAVAHHAAVGVLAARVARLRRLNEAVAARYAVHALRGALLLWVRAVERELAAYVEPRALLRVGARLHALVAAAVGRRA